MAKLERLLELARMARDRRVKNVREMSRVCGVSQRTIYRYLNTLAEVDVPNDLLMKPEQGKGGQPSEALDADDRCLIRYSLDHNPLVMRAFFANRFERLRRLLAPVANRTGRRLRGRSLEVGLPRQSSNANSEDKLLAAFERALVLKKSVKVMTHQSENRSLVLRPDIIKLTNGAIDLRFKDSASGKLVRISLDEISSIHVEAGDTRRGRSARSSRKKG
jgi:hypothetical protein